MALIVVLIAAAVLWAAKTDDRPAAPAKLSYQALSATSVKLSWTGPADVDKYVVRVGLNRAMTAQVTSIESTVRSTTLYGLPASSPGIDRYFRVDAYRDGEVSTSRTSAFSLAPGPLETAKIATLSPTGAKLHWRATTNTRQYDVVIARDKDFTSHVSAVRTVGAEPSFTTRSLSPRKTYFFKVRPVNGSTLGAFSAPLRFTTPPDAQTFILGTWNVCSEKCKGYSARARVGAAVLNEEDIDLFGLQEAGGVRVGRTTNAIFSGGSQGFVRATGGAKARYIFYRPALFSQLAGGYFYVGDGRHATWAKLKLKGSSQAFFYVNVHLEDGHGNDPKRVREMNVLLQGMAQLNPNSLPIIYAGDFNSGRHRSKDSPGIMMRAAGLVDAFDVSKSPPVNAQFNSGHSFSTHAPASGALIDHIFVSPEFSVSSWEQVVRMKDGRYLKPMVSDHNALKATLSLKAVPEPGLGDPTPVIDIPGATLSLR